MTRIVRHPPSRELWKFCLGRLRELRGPETAERELARVLGFEYSRGVRWKTGQMFVDRAEHLLRLADALGVEAMLLVELAAGTLNAEQALSEKGPVLGKGDDDRRPAPRRIAAVDKSTDASRFAIDLARFKAATRGTVLLIALSGEGRGDLEEVLRRHPDTGGLVATSVSVGLCLAERHRPELVLLDMGLASDQAFDACHALAGLTSRSQQLCRVVAGTSTVTDDIERAAVMAGAASAVTFPFPRRFLDGEIDRLEECLAPRKSAKK
jgi:CheY-like chemotaxis protein